MKGYLQESFFQVPIEMGEASEGGVEFPVLYFDSSRVTALFRRWFSRKSLSRCLVNAFKTPSLVSTGKPLDNRIICQ